MNGYRTQIFEMQNEPGGLCTAWKRKGYTFDGCLHSVGGINPNYKLYHYWNDLRKNNKQEYNQEKDRIAKEVIEILDQRFGDIINNIDVIDVATPATFKRYTNNWKGGTQGWEWTPRLIPEFIKKELPGLKNFYLIGQWVEPGGGVPTAAMSGRNVAQIICKRDKKTFVTAVS